MDVDEAVNTNTISRFSKHIASLCVMHSWDAGQKILKAVKSYMKLVASKIGSSLALPAAGSMALPWRATCNS